MQSEYYITHIFVFFKKGVSQQRSFGSGQQVKEEPVCQINERARK